MHWRSRVARAAIATLAATGVLIVPAPGAQAVQDPASCSATTISLTNGGFEQPVIPANTFRLINENSVPGWETTATDNLIELWHVPFLGVTPAEGAQHAELNATQFSTLFQDVPTVPGTTISYRVFHRGRGGVDVAQLQFGPPAAPANLTRTMTDGNRSWGRYTGTYTIPAGQTVTRFAFAAVSSAGGNKAIGNFIDGVQFGTPPCVLTTKSVTNLAGTDPAHPGDVLEYSVNVANQGGNDAGALVVTDGIPAGTAFVPGSLQVVNGPNAGTKSDAGDGDQAEYDPVGRQVRFRVGTGATGTAGGALGAGQSTTVRFRVTVLPSAQSTTITNAALTSWTDPINPGTPLSSTSNDVSIAVVAPAVDLVKSLTNIEDVDGNGQVSLGDELSFALTARNAGSEALSVVTVSDPRLADLACSPTTALGAPFSNGVSGLAIDDQVVCTGTMAVAQSDIDVGRATNTSSVAATGATGIAVADTDTVTVTTEAPAPALSLAKSASPAAGAAAGDTVTYTMVATNIGNVTISAAQVTDPTVGAVTCVPAAPATLAPGAAMVCMGSRTVTQADVDTGEVVNTATASGTDPVGNPVTATTSAIAPTAPRAGLLTIDKAMVGHDDLDANGSVSVGDVLNYEITVTNAGTVTQTGVSVSDSRAAGLVCAPVQPAVLAPGATLTCTGSTTVAQADVDAGSVVNTATATGTPPPGVTNPPAVATVDTPTEPALPRLAVVKNVISATDPDASGSYTPGDEITYQISAANTGNVVLTGVVVVDSLLAGLSCTPVVPATLAPGASVTCAGSYVVTAGDAAAGVRTNGATAAGTAPDGSAVQVDASLTVPITVPVPQVTVTKSVVSTADTNGSGSIDPGDSLTYEIIVTNTGNVLLTGIAVEDSRVPVTCAVPASLAPGASVACTAVTVVTQADQDAGQIENSATASGVDPQANLVSDTDTSVAATEGRRPDATFAKVVTGIDDVDGDGRNGVGDVANFELTLTNTGNVTLTGARISDDRLSSLSCTPTQPATLAPGEALVCTGAAPITQADQDAGVMVDHGVGTANHATGTITREAQAVVQPAPAQPALTTTKVAEVDDIDGSGAATVGETITYTIVVTNTGNVTLYGVAVTDLRLPGLSCVPPVPAVLAPLEAISCTGTSLVTQADVDQGQLANVATATGDDPRGIGVTGTGISTVTTDPPAPALSLNKTFTSSTDPDGSGTVSVGDTVTFTVVATNTGNVTLVDVEVTDPLLPELLCLPAPPATLAPTESVQCMGTMTVTQAHVDAGAVLNQATASGTSVDPSAAPVSATASGRAPTEASAPALSFTKVAHPLVDVDGSGGLSEGDTIQFVVTATNTGNVTLHEVAIADPMLPTLSCDAALPAALAPSQRIVCTGTHTVTAAESAAARVVNVATASAAGIAVLSATAELTGPTQIGTAPLARTGGDLARQAVPALGLLAAGSVLTAVSRVQRRRRSLASP